MMESGVLPYALHVEAEVHDVAVLNDVVLALDGQLASLADGRLRAILQVVGILDDLGADKAQSTSVTRPIISLFIRLPSPMSQQREYQRNVIGPMLKASRSGFQRM